MVCMALRCAMTSTLNWPWNQCLRIPRFFLFVQYEFMHCHQLVEPCFTSLQCRCRLEREEMGVQVNICCSSFPCILVRQMRILSACTLLNPPSVCFSCIAMHDCWNSCHGLHPHAPPMSASPCTLEPDIIARPHTFEPHWWLGLLGANRPGLLGPALPGKPATIDLKVPPEWCSSSLL